MAVMSKEYHAGYELGYCDAKEEMRKEFDSSIEIIKTEVNAIPIVTRHGQSGTVMTAQGMRKKIIEILNNHMNRPSTNTQRTTHHPSGRWIYNNALFDSWTCSNCKCDSDKVTDWCPNCGAITLWHGS